MAPAQHANSQSTPRMLCMARWRNMSLIWTGEPPCSPLCASILQHICVKCSLGQRTLPFDDRACDAPAEQPWRSQGALF